MSRDSGQTPRRQDAKVREKWAGVREAVRRVTAVLRQVVGAPDYQRYLAHHAVHHAGTTPLDPREYYAEFVSRRFGPGPTRCC